MCVHMYVSVFMIRVWTLLSFYKYTDFPIDNVHVLV